MARGTRAQKSASEEAPEAAPAPDPATGSSDGADGADAAAAAPPDAKPSRRSGGVPGWVNGLFWLGGTAVTFALQDWIRSREVRRLEAEEARVRADVA